MDIDELHTKCQDCRGYRMVSSGVRQPWHDRLDQARVAFMKTHHLDPDIPDHFAEWQHSDEYNAAGPSEEEIDANQVPCSGCDGVGYHLTYEGEQLVRFMRTHGFVQAER